MRKLLVTFVVWLLAVTASVAAEEPRDEGGRGERGEHPPNRPIPSPEAVLRATPEGLTLRRPYARGKVPVVFIHGLWATPRSWERMIVALESDPGLRDEYQFWTFRYATGDPIPYSARLLRRSLEEARRRFDPEKSESSFERMVLIGHSMGGLLAKMMVVESGTRLWHEVSDRPFEQLVGEPEDRGLFGQALLVKPLPEVRRVVFIATPHRGSKLNRGWLLGLGTRLAKGTELLRSAHDRLVARNSPGFFKDDFRKGVPTSLEELAWETPLLKSLHELPAAPDVKVHSIVAVRRDFVGDERGDGLVSFVSAHLQGANSEVVISAGHLCQDHPDAIREVRRILMEHLGL